jgi:DNA-binding CsgD family transcriptional regulator
MSPMPRPHANLLRDPASDPAHPAHALAAIDGIHNAQDAAQLLGRLVSATACLGATASIFVTLFPEQGDEPSSFNLFACDPRFAHDQLAVGPWPDHPWLRFARNHAAPGTEQDIGPASDKDHKAIALARQYGFVSCLVVPIHPGAVLGRLAMLCVGSEHEGYFQNGSTHFARVLAHALAGELHVWVTTHVRQHLQQAANLRAEDIALLSLEWQGLTSKAISQRTGLSVAAVDSRFQRLTRRLDCASRSAAARRAAEYGVLESAAVVR